MNQLMLVATQLTTLIHSCFTGSSPLDQLITLTLWKDVTPPTHSGPVSCFLALGGHYFFSPAIRFYQRCCLTTAGPIPAGMSLCAGFHYVFSGSAAQPSMMLQPPPLTSAQERRLVAWRRDEPSSCENTAGARSSREKEKRC